MSRSGFLLRGRWAAICVLLAAGGLQTLGLLCTPPRAGPGQGDALTIHLHALAAGADVLSAVLRVAALEEEALLHVAGAPLARGPTWRCLVRADTPEGFEVLQAGIS